MVLEQLSEDCEQSEKMISSLHSGSPTWVFPKAPPSFDQIRRSSKTGFVIYIGVMTGLLSFVIIGLFNNHLKFEEDNSTGPSRRVQDLVNLLRQAEDKQENLEKEIVRLRASSAVIPDNARHHLDQQALQEVNADPGIQKLAVFAGLTPQTGPGIVVTLNDLPGMQNLNQGRAAAEGHNRLQSDDLLKLVNELKAAGANAISVNGQRVISGTAIVNSGSSILINHSRINAPVEISALGNPAVLKASLMIRGGILEYLQFFGIQTSVAEMDRLTIPAYSGSMS